MGRTYAVTDLHGMWDLWEQIKNYCQPDDTIYFLGDAADRGPDGVKVMQDLLADKRVFYLKGNHEDMMVCTIKEILNGYLENVPLWVTNGGKSTMTTLLEMNVEELQNLLNKIKSLPDYVKIVNTKGQNIFLSHAGTAFDYDNAELFLIHGNRYLWDRRHFNRPWPKEGYENWFIVHGHTPWIHLIQSLNEVNQFYNRPLISDEKIEIVEYCDGHKFGLDLGSFITNKVALFDLDELKVEKYFETKE